LVGGPAAGVMNNITVTLMTYGADLGEMLGGLVALMTLCLALRRPRGKHRKRRGPGASEGQESA
jgi:hypothetical protein